MPEIEKLATKLTSIRKEINKTQTIFAEHCGLSEEEISLIERRKTDPKLSTLQNIAAYLGQTTSDLLKIDD